MFLKKYYIGYWLNRPVTQLKNALTGQIAGVTVTNANGRPGAGGGAIRVRGVGSFGATPDALIIIDGIAGGNFNNIDPNDVESISVLKDASSAAIYGARAANGVILVTTKSGNRSGKATVSYNGYYGTQRPTALPEFVNSWSIMLNMPDWFVFTGAIGSLVRVLIIDKRVVISNLGLNIVLILILALYLEKSFFTTTPSWNNVPKEILYWLLADPPLMLRL